MAKRILVPLDESAESEAVVPLVAEMARSGGASVRLLHVAPIPGNVVDDDGRVRAYSDQEARRLEVDALDYLRTVELMLDGVPVECSVRFGDPFHEILLEADAFDADLIALTARRRRAVGRVFRLGVARRIFRRARTPVLVFRSALEAAA